jgi:sulfite exporter TauE/SafE
VVVLGALHGIAGGAHLLTVLPAWFLPSLSQTAVYLAAFAAGTILTMSLFCHLVSRISARVQVRHGAVAYRWLMGTCGTTALVVGGFWLLG